MSDELTPIEQAIATGAEPDAVEPETPDTPEVESAEVDAAEELILGKFKTHEDLAKAYSELEGKMRAGEHKTPDPEPEADPFDWLPPNVSEETWQQAAYAFQTDPVRAAATYYQNPQRLGQQLTNEILNEFAKENPVGWSQAWSLINQPQQSNEPSRAEQYVDRQETLAVSNWASQELPEFEKYKERVAEILTGEHAEYYGQFIQPGNPDSYANVVQSIYRDLVYQDWESEYKQQAAQPEAPQPVPAAKRTATKSTAGRPAPASNDQTIQEMIANARA